MATTALFFPKTRLSVLIVGRSVQWSTRAFRENQIAVKVNGTVVICIMILAFQSTTFAKALPLKADSQANAVYFEETKALRDEAITSEERQALEDIQPYIVDSGADVDVRVYKAKVRSEGAGYYKEPDVFSEQIGDIQPRANIFVQPAREKGWLRSDYQGETGYLYVDQVEINCESVRTFGYIQLGYYFTQSAIALRDDLKAFRTKGIQGLKVYIKNKTDWVEYRLALGPYLSQTDLEKATILLQQKNVNDYEIRAGLDDESFFHRVSCENASMVEKKRNAERKAKEKAKKNKLAANKKRLEADRIKKSKAKLKRQKEIARKNAAADTESVRRLSGEWSGTVKSIGSGLTGTVWLKIWPSANGFGGKGRSKIDRKTLLSLFVVSCLPTASVTGTVTGSMVKAIARGKEGEIEYTGKIAGDRIMGNYTVISGQCKSDKGTFSIRKK